MKTESRRCVNACIHLPATKCRDLLLILSKIRVPRLILFGEVVFIEVLARDLLGNFAFWKNRRRTAGCVFRLLRFIFPVSIVRSLAHRGFDIRGFGICNFSGGEDFPDG